MAQYAGKSIQPGNPQSYGGPPPPTAQSSGPSPKPGPSVHPQPVGGTGTPPASVPPKAYAAAAARALRRKGLVKPSRKSDVFSLPWVLITILGLVLAYDILTMWKGAVSIETAGFNAATWAVKAIEGNSAGNQSASRPGRQPGT